MDNSKRGTPIEPIEYVSVPVLQPAYFDLTPKIHREFGGSRITRLAALKENQMCKAAEFHLESGKLCSLIFPRDDLLDDPALKHLSPSEYAALREHVLSA